MARLSNSTLEAKIVRSLVGSKLRVRTYLFSKLKHEHFTDPPVLKVFKRLKFLASLGKSPTNLNTFSQDASFETEESVLLYDKESSYKANIVRTLKDAKTSYRILEDYKKLRVVYKTAKDGLDLLKKNKNVDEILEHLSSTISEAKTKTGEDHETLSVGQLDEDEEQPTKYIENITSRRIERDLIKTGLVEFDMRTGGFSRQQLVIFAANTSGGKSVLAMQIALHAYLQDSRSVAIVSLEMSQDMYWTRIITHVTQLNATDLFYYKLGKKQKEIIKKDYKSLSNHGKKVGSKFTVVCPNYALTINEIADTLATKGYDLVIIDMLTLLKRDARENEPQVLSTYARDAKLASKRLNCVMICLAQLKDDGDIKYSRGIKEHADFCWFWKYGQKEEETHVVEIKQEKHRNAPGYKFLLKENFKNMRFEDYDPRTYAEDLEKQKEESVTPVTMNSLVELEGDDEL